MGKHDKALDKANEEIDKLKPVQPPKSRATGADSSLERDLKEIEAAKEEKN